MPAAPPCPGLRCKAARRRPGARRRGSTGPWRPRQRSRQTRRQRPSASSSSTAVGFAAPRTISATMGITAPCATAAARETSAAATAISAAATAAAAAVTTRHPGGWGPSRVCFRCGQPGHFYAECRAVPPAPLNACPPAPYITSQHDQQVNYSVTSPGDCASSSGEHGHLMPTPPAPHGTPAPSDSSWSFSTDRAVMTQFCPPGESVDLSGFVSSSSARIVPTSAFAAQSYNSSRDFWIGDSGASCHMTNDA